MIVPPLAVVPAHAARMPGQLGRQGATTGAGSQLSGAAARQLCAGAWNPGTPITFEQAVT
jgi:hypothetical protein